MPNKEYPYYFIKLGRLYYVTESCRHIKRKEISSYEFTNDELVAFPFDTQSIAKKTIDGCNGILYSEIVYLRIILAKENAGISI